MGWLESDRGHTNNDFVGINNNFDAQIQNLRPTMGLNLIWINKSEIENNW